MKNTYQIDSPHSSAQFSVRHLMVSNVKGTFGGVSGTVSYDPENPGETGVEATIDVASINTNDEKRDAHLKSPDFFDVEKYPKMSFKSTSAKKTGDAEIDVLGDLTLHGATQPVTLHVEEISSESKDPWGNVKIGAVVKGKIKRTDFGLGWNAALETGGVLVGEDVKLELDLQLLKA